MQTCIPSMLFKVLNNSRLRCGAYFFLFAFKKYLACNLNLDTGHADD